MEGSFETIREHLITKLLMNVTAEVKSQQSEMKQKLFERTLHIETFTKARHNYGLNAFVLLQKKRKTTKNVATLRASLCHTNNCFNDVESSQHNVDVGSICRQQGRSFGNLDIAEARSKCSAKPNFKPKYDIIKTDKTTG